MRMKKRFFSMLLCIVLCLSLMPMSAFAADEVESYDVWVNGEQFTSETLTITCGEGAASYDHDTNTVTLDGAQITSANNKGAIYAGNQADRTLTVNVIGDSSIHLDSDTNTIGGIYADTLVLNASKNLDICVDNKDSGGIYTNGRDVRFPDSGDVTISGSGNVTINSGDNGIYSTGSVTFSGSGDVTVAARSNGIYSYNEVTISGSGNVNITSQYNYGIFEYGDVTISASGDVKIQGFYSGVYIGKVGESGRNLILSGSGKVDIGGTQRGVTLWGDGKVFLNGTGSLIKLHAGSTCLAVYNGDTKDSPVVGSNLDKYEVIGDPASESVVYARKTNVWVNGEQFTTEKSTITCGSGTATYDPATNTVTLNNAKITSAYNTGAIRANGALTVNVVGDSSITLDSSIHAHGIFADRNLTLTGPGNLDIRVESEYDGLETIVGNIVIAGSGDVTVNAGAYGVYTGEEGYLNITGSGDVDIYGEWNGAYGGYFQLLLNGTGKTVKLSGGNRAYNDEDGESIVAGFNVGDYEVAGGPASTSVVYTFIGNSYDLWVGGTQVTNDNKNDIFGNGTVSFNTDTNTLTLNNATLTESYEYEPYYESVIYSALPSLTVNLTGTNEIAPTSTYSDGIDAAGGCNITVTGNGTLNITNGYYGFYVGSYDVPGGNLTIDGATLNVSGTLAAGIWVNHDISFTDSTVRVIVTNDFYTGLVSNIDGTITVTNSDIQVSAIKAAIHMGNTDESDHSLVLNSGTLTLNSNNGYGIWTEPDVYSSVNGTITINGGRLNVISALGVSNIPMSNLTVAEGWGFTTGSSLTDSNVTISPACYTIVGYKNEGPDGAIAEVKINGETVQEHTNTSGTLKISTGAQDVSVEVKFNRGYTFGQCADGVILRWGGVQSGSTNINSSTVSNSINMPNSASLENGSGDRELYLIIQTQSLPEFDVNVQTDGNGTASANPTSAAKGDTVTLTAVPNEGYHFKEWQSSDVTVSNDTFTMPEKAVTVKAIFEKDAPDHTHVGTLQNGTPATCTIAGFKDYYTCSCGLAFEDATCNIEIADLDAWKAEGGNGYIAPTGHGETEPSETEPSVTEPSETEPSATETEKLLGDANNDNAVNMKDVLLIRKFLAGMDVSVDMANSDVNEDTFVNMKDVLMLRKFLAGLVDKLGA